MCDHDRTDAVLREHAKRHEFNIVQAFHIVRNLRQIVMTIHIRIAVTRKMFRTRHHAVVLHTAHIHKCFRCDIFFIFTERAFINHRIVGVVVHIGIGCVIDVNAEAFQIFCHLRAEFINQTIILNSTQHHLFRVSRNGFFQTHIQTPFRIHRHEQRHSR